MSGKKSFRFGGAALLVAGFTALALIGGGESSGGAREPEGPTHAAISMQVRGYVYTCTLVASYGNTVVARRPYSTFAVDDTQFAILKGNAAAGFSQWLSDRKLRWDRIESVGLTKTAVEN